MEEKKFSLEAVYDMPNIASVFSEKLGLNNPAEIAEKLKTLEGREIQTLENKVTVHFDEKGVYYEGQEDEYPYSTDPVFVYDDLELVTTNLPYFSPMTYGDLFTLLDNKCYCKGATCVPSKLVTKMGYNLGHRVMAVLSLFYGLVNALLG